MIIREILARPTAILVGFDFFNDYDDTRAWLLGNGPADLIARLDEAHAEWLRRFHQEKRRTEPKRVRLTTDYLDLKAGIAYPEGTVLVRSSWSGQYLIEGTPFGGECVACFALIRDCCEIAEGAPP